MPAKRKSDWISEPFRFGLVGIANTITGLAVIFAGLAMGLGDVPANMLGYAVGLTQGFILNRRWTFDHAERRAGEVIGRYVVAFAVSYLINLAIVLALTSAGVAGIAPHIAAALVYTAAFFVLSRDFVFVPRANPRPIASLAADHFDVVLVVVAAALYFLLKDVPIGHDQSWYLISVQKILAGARPYVDVIELNPPLNFYLMMPPVYLAERLGAVPEHAFIAYVIGLACVSTLWARRLLLKLPTVPAGHANIAAIIALLSTTALAVFDFGQRDVLLVIFTLPYLALSMCRIEGSRLSWPSAASIGLWAALGICLKHYFLVFLIATEIVLYLKRRKISGVLRPEVLAVGVAGVVYAVAIVTLFPAYLGVVVPMARATYFAYGVHFPQTLLCAETLTLPLVLGAYLVLRRRRQLEGWLDMLAAWMIAAFVSYAIQDRGFTYHAEPLRIFMVFMAVSVVGRKFDAPAPLPKFCLLAGLALMAIRVEVLGLYDDEWATEAKQKVERYGVRDGIYTFTAHVFIGFPLANRIDGPWVSRFPCLWPVPGAQRILAAPQDFTPAQRAAAERADRYVTDAVVEDFERQMPSIVIVDARKDKSYFEGVKFDYVANFQRDPRFARLWLNYRLAENFNGFEIWRKDPTGRAVTAP